MSRKNKLQDTGYRLQIGGFILALFLPFYIYSQTSTSSPYSRFGLGELQNKGFANSFGMGGVSYAYQNDSLAPFYINSSNPASHSKIKLTTFDIAVMNNQDQLQTTSEKTSANRTALNYFSVGFPIKKWWGMAVGLNPYSSVGYKAGNSEEIDSIGTVNYVYEGNGGVNELWWGNGFVYKNFSFGINTSYLFGRSNYIARDSFPDLVNVFSSKVTRTTDYNDVFLKFGLQYKTNLKKSWTFSLGATASLQKNLSARYTYLAETYKYVYLGDVIKDTAWYAPDSSVNVTLPMMLGFGFKLNNEKWMIGFDYSMQNWSKFTAFNQSGYLTNSNRFSLGLQYTPDRTAEKGSYLRRMNYRLGFRYENSYLLMGKDNQIKDMALSFGFGFPLRKLKVGDTYNQSVMNLSFELGERGTTDNNLVLERYFRVVLGFTLNEKWFNQRKYD